MSDLDITIGMPPGLVAINRRYAKNFKLDKSWKAARDELVLLFAQEWMGKPALAGDVGVAIFETWPTHAGDIDSPIKAVLDALEHAEVYGNDKQVVDLQVIKEPSGPAALRVVVWDRRLHPRTW